MIQLTILETSPILFRSLVYFGKKIVLSNIKSKVWYVLHWLWTKTDCYVYKNSNNNKKTKTGGSRKDKESTGKIQTSHVMNYEF